MEPEPATLCNFCVGLISPKDEPSTRRAHYSSVVSLEKSSQTCSICKVLLADWTWKKVQERFPKLGHWAYNAIHFEVNLKDVQTTTSALSWAIIKASVTFQDTTYTNNFSVTVCNPECSLTLHLLLSDYQTDSLFAATSASQPSWKATSTSSADKTTALKSWLHDCELKHQKCKPPTVGLMPKRLIHVGSLGERPRLVISEDLNDHDIRYATLSYCWGNAKFCTTKKNENLHKQEIPYHLLPPTLQDAISLTCHLGIQFLWIDALCIVQNDHAEWEIEAAKMQDIYSGSSITIAATDAADSSEGLFSPNPNPDPKQDKISAFLAVRSIRNGLGAIVRVQPNDIRLYSENSVLNTRGWVLQEMVLSNRIVHCMRSGFYWECRSNCRTETGLIFDRSTMSSGTAAILPHDSQIGMNKVWWEWIESYSRRRFSFGQDRLFALAGIIRHYQKATKDIPILGLWERSLHHDLLWVKDDRSFSCHLSNIPSWTWLSCSSPIFHDVLGNTNHADLVIHDHVKIVEWAVNWTNEPLTSEIKSTRLVLDGPVRDIVLSVSSNRIINPPDLDAGNETPRPEDRSRRRRYRGQFDNGIRIYPTEYLCLLLRTRGDESEQEETFLILEPCLNTNMHRRVGIANCISYSGRSFDLRVRRTLSLV
jgi:hypothetical protein